MESAAVNQDRKGRLVRMLCDVTGVLLGLLFLVAGLFLLNGTIDYMRFGGSGGRHINSAIGAALGVVALLFLSVCLALPTKLYEDRRLRIAGRLAASMTSAVTVASAVLPVVLIVLDWVIEPPSPGSSGADVGGLVVLVMMVVGLAGILIFLPCTYILARKARTRPRHLAIGTLVAGALGSLAVYLCY
jgi:hypothetical protein